MLRYSEGERQQENLMHRTDPDDYAFPVADSHWTGLTKREYIAAAALQGLLANPYLREDNNLADYSFAKEAVRQADDLIAELQSSHGE
jgi:hypothetical protein